MRYPSSVDEVWGLRFGVDDALVHQSLDWLSEQGDPSVDLWLATEIDGRARSECGDLVAAVHESDAAVDAFSAQHADGSWGADDPDGRTRILPTLAMLQTLAAYGVGHHDRTAAAMGFLCAEAHTEHEVFTFNGRRDGVLSCYVGTAASVYLALDAPALAEPQISWILRYQDVARAGHRYRTDEPDCWDDYLRTRYGGCMAETTCLVGLVKAGRALQRFAKARVDGHLERDVAPLQRALRDAFLDRSLMFRGDDAAADETADRPSDREIVPIGVAATKAADWLRPTFPLDWRTDLIEVLDMVARSGPPDARMQPAVDVLLDWRLPDGSWPLRRSMWPDELSVRDRKSQHRGHPIVTMRAVSALRAALGSANAPG